MKSISATILTLIACGFALTARAEDEIATTFTYSAADAKNVGVAGEFSNWQIVPMKNGDDGKWTKTVYLKPGTYGYKIIVDGEWMFDPTASQRKKVNEIENSAVTVGETRSAEAVSTQRKSSPPAQRSATFTYVDSSARSVSVAGEFNNWDAGATPMQKDAAGGWIAKVPLKPGRYQYKFVVDGDWKKDPATAESADDGFGGKNSVKIVED